MYSCQEADSRSRPQHSRHAAGMFSESRGVQLSIIDAARSSNFTQFAVQ
jgi:hypothetical protein